MLHQSTALRPFPWVLVIFAFVAMWASQDKVIDIVSRNIATRYTTKRIRMVNIIDMLTATLFKLLLTVVTAIALPFQKFLDLSGGMTSRYRTRTSTTKATPSYCLIFMCEVVQSVRLSKFFTVKSFVVFAVFMYPYLMLLVAFLMIDLYTIFMISIIFPALFSEVLSSRFMVLPLDFSNMLFLSYSTSGDGLTVFIGVIIAPLSNVFIAAILALYTQPLTLMEKVLQCIRFDLVASTTTLISIRKYFFRVLSIMLYFPLCVYAFPAFFSQVPLIDMKELLRGWEDLLATKTFPLPFKYAVINFTKLSLNFFVEVTAIAALTCQKIRSVLVIIEVLASRGFHGSALRAALHGDIVRGKKRVFEHCTKPPLLSHLMLVCCQDGKVFRPFAKVYNSFARQHSHCSILTLACQAKVGA